MRAVEVYEGSDGAATKRFYADLETRGPLGLIAVNLFRAQKCSARAKKYRGGVRGVGSYRGMAYERKSWSVSNLCQILAEHGPTVGITFGWGLDLRQEFNRYVLYVDLPQGQVSFHSPSRGKGPDYQGQWDGQHRSAERILAFCDVVMFGRSDPAQIGLQFGDSVT